MSISGLSYGVVRVEEAGSITSLTLQDVGLVMPGGEGVTLKYVRAENGPGFYFSVFNEASIWSKVCYTLYTGSCKACVIYFRDHFLSVNLYPTYSIINHVCTRILG